MKRALTRGGSPPTKRQALYPSRYNTVQYYIDFGESSGDDYESLEEDDEDYLENEVLPIENEEIEVIEIFPAINERYSEYEDEDDFDDDDEADYEDTKYTKSRVRAKPNKISKMKSQENYYESESQTEIYQVEDNAQCHWEGILPDEILLEIFKYHDQLQLIDNWGVCKQWRKVAEEPQFWRSIVYNDSYGYEGLSELFGWCASSEIISKHVLYISLIGLPSSRRLSTKVFQRFSNLIYFNAKGIDYLRSDRLQGIIENCKNLKWLNASYCSGNFNSKVFNFPNPENMTYISLHHTNIKFTTLHVLQKLTNLKMLLLAGCLCLAEGQRIASCDFPSLEYLDISHTDLSDLGICNIIWESKNLNVLMLSGCKSVTGQFLGAKSLSNLTGLDISKTLIEDQYLPTISTLTKLVRVDMSWCKFTEDTLFHMVELIKELKGCLMFEEFYSVGTHINDETANNLVQECCQPGALINLSSCRKLSRSLRSLHSQDYSEAHRFIFPPPPFTVNDCLNTYLGMEHR